ncbi:MAG TPA: P-loop NTPase, partial [Magnetococcales bacterium]|nr:P-loop NTPase [Magnetococcales bacterium]
MSTLHTIVFYSYKGGVGRSLALYHLTKHLAQQGKKVVLMDLDLEAPGLPFKFNLREQIPGGMVDLLDDFAKHEKNPEDRLYELMVQPRFAEQDRVEWQGFAPVRLLAAGNPLDLGYWKRLAQLNWQDMFYSEPRWGVGFFLEVKEIIRDKYDPDYLLIDARTGITEMGGAALALLADQVVCLFVNNMENHYGIRSVMRGIRTVIRPPGAEPISIIPVVTRIPERMLSEDQLTSELQEFFNKPAENLAATLNIHQVFVLHSHPPLEIDESQAIDEKAALFLDYKKLFQVLRPPEPTIHKKYTSPPLERPIRWLHLSDLHMGSPGRTLWWQVHEEFKTSILAAVEQSGPPDCILITGDLTWRGQASDFHLLDQFLAELLGWLRKEGREDPLIIPVPGNHDLSRPKGMATLPYSVLEKFGKGRDDPAIALLLDTLWEEKDASYLAPLFANYQEWLERTILPVLRQRKGVSCVTSH